MRYFYGVKLFTRAQIQSLKSSWIVHSVGMIFIIVIVTFFIVVIVFLKKNDSQNQPFRMDYPGGF